MLQPTPDSFEGQLEVLRALDDDVDRAAVANEAYRDGLAQAMERVDHARKRMRALETLLQSLTENMASLASPAAARTPGPGTQDVQIVAPGTLTATTPYFRYFYGRNLPLNEDAKSRERYLSTVRAKPWQNFERERLEQEIRAQNHRIVVQEALQAGRDMTEAVAEKDPAWFIENTEGLDWEQVSLVLERRTATECRIQWLEQQHPLIRSGVTRSGKSNFSKDEMTKLNGLVTKRGVFGGREGWEGIAKALNTGRTAAACFRAYNLRPSQPRETWSTEDDSLLLSSLHQYGQNWALVSRMVGRSIPSCLVRFTNALDPSTTRGKWSAEEDAALRRAIKKVGIKSWAEVSERVKGRTDQQCRERWTNAVDPRIIGYGGWTEEEDEALRRMRDDEGRTWIDISERGFEGRRTDNSCLRRYGELVKRNGPAPPKPGPNDPPKRPRGRPPKKRYVQQQAQLAAGLAGAAAPAAPPAPGDGDGASPAAGGGEGGEAVLGVAGSGGAAQPLDDEGEGEDEADAPNAKRARLDGVEIGGGAEET
ncbi:hypothetical protein BMF94_2446 [Rhodotorula taiwanensis]|uniref:Uncharacterized protein n=1 Tax=Rhodotorula taiwanensis TaxID=741276 RepID=A0A2S5BD39_9BASI|nr:hypothetical protein BMF94_2446 [Rhodotorula taiwanensis]